MFHSLIYDKRQQSVSYFVQYAYNNDVKERRFGIIRYFFPLPNQGHAVIEQYPIKFLYSDYFKKSKYYNLLEKTVGLSFFCIRCVLSTNRSCTY